MSTPEGMDVAAASAELAAAVRSDQGLAPEAGGPPATPAPEQSAPAVETVAQDQPAPEAPVEQPVVEEESFIPRADLEALLAEVEDEAAKAAIAKAYKSFQSGFTKRTQELAEQRKAFGEVDPQTAVQAYEFVSALQNDNQFAAQVHQALSNHLQAQGMPAGQAEQAAASAMDSALDDYGIDPENPLVQRLNELENWKKQAEFAYRQEQIVRDIERQDSELRRTNPSWSDQDWDTVYKIAAATEGDLFEAAEYFRANVKDRIIADYVASKASVPAGVQTVQGTGHSEIPQSFDNLDQADAAAREFLRNALAQD